MTVKYGSSGQCIDIKKEDAGSEVWIRYSMLVVVDDPALLTGGDNGQHRIIISCPFGILRIPAGMAPVTEVPAGRSPPKRRAGSLNE